MKKTSGGSRPPLPYRSAKTGALSIFFIMGLVLAAATASTGGGAPIDPNSAAGPPTLEPYYDPNDYPKQKIVLPTDPQTDADTNLQLKTFNVSNCGENSVMIFLIDTSGSMKYAGKMDNTKRALRYFVDNLGGKSVVGIYTFSKDVKQEVPITLLKEARTEVDRTINNFKPDGWTRTKDGMQMAYEAMAEVIDDKAYPGYKYNLILMTDGVPEVPPTQPRTCIAEAYDPNTAPAMRCFAKEQDPRLVGLPDKIKGKGVGIYSINIYSPSYPSDAVMFPHLEKLLKEVSSTPVDTHYYASINGSNLTKLLENIGQNICQKSY